MIEIVVEFKLLFPLEAKYLFAVNNTQFRADPLFDKRRFLHGHPIKFICGSGVGNTFLV